MRRFEPVLFNEPAALFSLFEVPVRSPLGGVTIVVDVEEFDDDDDEFDLVVAATMAAVVGECDDDGMNVLK
jgi:hypothetical protein